MKTNFLYDFCFLELLICLCDISYCFQVHRGYSLPMLLLNSFFSSFKSNKLVPNNLSEWTTEQKKNTYWKNHFSTCELTRVCESLLPSSVKSLTITNYSLWWLKRKKKILNNQDYPLFLLWDSCQLFSEPVAGVPEFTLYFFLFSDPFWFCVDDILSFKYFSKLCLVQFLYLNTQLGVFPFLQIPGKENTSWDRLLCFLNVSLPSPSTYSI